MYRKKLVLKLSVKGPVEITIWEGGKGHFGNELSMCKYSKTRQQRILACMRSAQHAQGKLKSNEREHERPIKLKHERPFMNILDP